MAEPGGLRRVAARGLLVILLAKVTSVVLAQAAAILLPLLLSPEEFGILGIVGFFVGVLALASDFGLSTDLVRRTENLDLAYRTAFSIRVLLSVALLVISVPTAYLAVAIYRDVRLLLPTIVYASTFVLGVFSFVPRIRATKALDFPRAVLPDQVGKAVVAGASIALAAFGFGYYGPIIGGILGTLVGSILFFIAVPWKPQWSVDAAMARSLFAFSKFVVITSFLFFAVSSLDKVLVGYVLGLAPLGYYVVAYSWAVGLPSNIATVVSGVAYPIYGHVVKDAPERLRRAYSETTRLFAYVGIFVAVGVIALAEPFVSSVLGSRWLAAILPMQILAIGGVFMGIAGLSNDLLNALGKSRLVALVQSMGVLALCGGLYVGMTTMGLGGASVAVTVAFVVLAATSRYLARRELKYVAGLSLLGVYVIPSAGAGLAFSGAFLLGLLLPGGTVGLLARFVVYASVYLVAMEFLTHGAFLDELRMVGRMAVGGTKS